MSLAFLFCVERGALESQALLLCQSIRRYGGRFRDAAIHAFEPREGREAGAGTRAALAALGVQVHSGPCNTGFRDYAYGNKIFACARAEETLGEDVLVFLDTDTLLVGEPAELDLPAGVSFAALPAYNGRLGSAGPGDPLEPYWRRLYEICGVEGDPFVTTVIDRRTIRASFNSGLIAVRREAGLFAAWRRDFLLLMAEGHVLEAAGVAGMDELSLAAALGRARARGRILDARYNYPLQLRERALMPEPLGSARLEELVHVHYRFWFHLPGFLERLEPRLDLEGEVASWLAPRLPLAPVIDDEWIDGMRRAGGRVTIHDVHDREAP